MTLDPTTPVIVGVGQLTRRPDDLADATEPAEMMAEVLRRAADDARAPGLLAAIDSIRIVESMSWKYPDPGRAVARRVGAEPRQSVYTHVGGNTPQMLLNHTALAVQRGEVRVAAIAGAEAIWTRRRARKEGFHLAWTPIGDSDPGAKPDLVLGEERFGTSNAEMAAGLMVPVQVYPLFENALRAAAGESVEEHQVKVSELWARFSQVASTNPHAWSPEPRTPEEIRTPGPDNRMVSFPYPKLMNSNIETDQAAGLLLCSVEAARQLGVPEDRWVFPHSGADANDHWHVTERDELFASPAIRLAGRAVMAAAGATADEIAYVDIYSCFPSAVQVGANELGFPLDRQLTVTGGLCFAGGPGNNYVTHSIATMVERLREDPDALGLCTAVGWYLTKHAIGVYGARPPANGFRHTHPQDEIDALPRREVVEGYEGAATIESWTVMYARDGSPETAIVVTRTDDGRRALAARADATQAADMVVVELVGRPVKLRGEGGFDLG